MKLLNRKRIWHTLVLWVVVLLIAVMTLFVHIPEAHGGQKWRLQVTFGLLEQTQCGPDTFDTKPACEAFKAWVTEKAAWHGQNTYECVLDSQCPSN